MVLASSSSSCLVKHSLQMLLSSTMLSCESHSLHSNSSWHDSHTYFSFPDSYEMQIESLSSILSPQLSHVLPNES